MRQIPHRIEKLVLINAAARAVCEKGQSERERSLDLINKGKFDFLVNLIFKNSIHDKKKYHELIPLLKTMAQEIGAERYIQQLTAILNKPDQTEVLKTIQCPTLLIASIEDNVMPIGCGATNVNVPRLLALELISISVVPTNIELAPMTY